MQKRKGEKAILFSQAEKSWLLEKWNEHHFSLRLILSVTLHPGEAFPEATCGRTGWPDNVVRSVVLQGYPR